MVEEGGSLLGSVSLLHGHVSAESLGVRRVQTPNTPTRKVVTSGLSVPMATDGLVWGYLDLTVGLD